MWSPNSKQPLVEMFTHKGSVLGIAVDQQRGHLMATTGLDRRLRVWDLRMCKELCAYSASYTDFSHLAFSQTGCLAVAAEDAVQIFNNVHNGTVNAPYLTHRCRGLVTDLQFCAYEDVLGVGHERGFVSVLVPGSGDSNFDALRANPFESNRQRREREVRMLLDKIQPELITLNPSDINRVNRKGLKETMDYKANVMHIKPTQITDVED
uniref:BING4 C-terminal domain-containing protein n=1 Tax=Globodera rostochiensis TaxID=31243 RepID=A0A914I5L9_GLORO